MCILCNITISCAQHGAAAVKRHATMKKHLETAAKHRDKNGVLQPPKTVQATIDFSTGRPRASVQDQVCEAEAIFVMSVVSKSIPYSWADTATDMYKRMFPDSDIAKNFSCGRTKLSYIVSDGLGPHFKSKIIAELCRPNVFFSLMIDETPKPEQRVQQLDVLIRYFSESQKQVVVEHLQSFNLGRATGDIIAGCVEDALAELPTQGLLCFFSDGPNVMKSVKAKLKRNVNPNLVDIGECNLHKVHNAFAKGLDVFCSDVEELVRDVYYYFKHAVRAEGLKEHQKTLGIAPHVFLRHVSNRWLTLQDSLSRVQEQFMALQSFFSEKDVTVQRSDAQTQHNRLASAFSSKTLYAKILFLKNAAELFVGFQKLFQRQEPLLHILHSELLALVLRVLSRVLRSEAFCEKSAEDLQKLNLDDAALWKVRPEVGSDTEKVMEAWDHSQKKAFRLGARAFYLACSKALLQKLPLANKVILHARFLALEYDNAEMEVRSLRYLAAQLPQVLGDDQVSSLIDEWHILKCSGDKSAKCTQERIDDYWAKVFSLRSATGEQKYPLLSRLIKALLSLPHGNADCERGFSENKHLLDGRSSLSIASINGMRHIKTHLRRYEGDATKVPLSLDLIRSVKQSRVKYAQRTAAEEATSKQKPSKEDCGLEQCRLAEEKKVLEDQVAASRALLTSAQELISSGVKRKDMDKVQRGHILLTKGNSSLERALGKLQELSKQISKKPKH